MVEFWHRGWFAQPIDAFGIRRDVAQIRNHFRDRLLIEANTGVGFCLGGNVEKLVKPKHRVTDSSVVNIDINAGWFSQLSEGADEVLRAMARVHQVVNREAVAFTRELLAHGFVSLAPPDAEKRGNQFGVIYRPAYVSEEMHIDVRTSKSFIGVAFPGPDYRIRDKDRWVVPPEDHVLFITGELLDMASGGALPATQYQLDPQMRVRGDVTIYVRIFSAALELDLSNYPEPSTGVERGLEQADN